MRQCFKAGKCVLHTGEVMATDQASKHATYHRKQLLVKKL